MSEVDVCLLLLSRVLKDLVWSHVVWELSDEVVVACSKAPLDQVSLLVRVVVQQLRQVGKFVMLY